MRQLLAALLGSREAEPESRADTDADTQVEAHSDTHVEVPKPEGPWMFLLVRDASSLGAYQLHSFRDENEASEFVRFWFPPGFEHGALAFWTGHEQGMRLPGFHEKRAAEVLILIHGAAEPEVVHPFAMPDMELARSWLEEEEEKHGLDLRDVSIYWAARAEISRDADDRPNFRPVELPVYQPPAEEPEEGRAKEREKEVTDIVVATTAIKTRVVRKGKDGDGHSDSERPAGTHSEKRTARKRRAGKNGRKADKPRRERAEPAADASPNEPPRVPGSLEEWSQESRWEQKDEPFSTFGSPPGRF